MEEKQESKSKNSKSWVDIVSIIVAIISLFFSYYATQSTNKISEKQIVQDKEIIYINNQLSKEKDEYDHVKEVVFDLYSNIIKVEFTQPPIYTTDCGYDKGFLYLSNLNNENIKSFSTNVDEFIVIAHANSLVLPDVFMLDVDALRYETIKLETAYVLLKDEKSEELATLVENYEKQLTKTLKRVNVVKNYIEDFFTQLDITASNLLEDNADIEGAKEVVKETFNIDLDLVVNKS